MLEQIVVSDGSTRRLGNIERSARLKAWPTYGSTAETPLVPRDDWAARINALGSGPEFPFLPYVHDQDGIAQCNPEAVTAAVESCRLQQGLPFIPLCPGDLYDRVNAGRDDGSVLEDAMHEVMVNGIGTADSCGGTLWTHGFHAASNAERRRFRVLEAFDCPTFAHCMSAVLEGFRIITGMMWFDGDTPDPDGWLPRPRGRSGGHAVMGYKPAIRNGQFGIWHQNSWSTQFGLAGRFVIPESRFDQSIGGWWAVRSVVDEGGIVPMPV